jgi:hypothetical protein
MALSMKRHTYLTMSIVLAIAAGALAYFGYSHAVREDRILIAEKNIPPNSQVSGADLTFSEMPAAAVQQYGYLTTPSELEGRYLSVGIAKGQPISAKDVSSAKDLNALLASYQQKTKNEGVILPFQNSNLFTSTVKPGQEIALSFSGEIHHKTVSGLVGPIKVLSEQMVKGKPMFILFVSYPQYQLIGNDILHGTSQIILYTKGVPLLSASKLLAEPQANTVSVSTQKTGKKG